MNVTHRVLLAERRRRDLDLLRDLDRDLRLGERDRRRRDRDVERRLDRDRRRDLERRRERERL